MLKAIVTALAFALLATSLFALRFRFERNIKQLLMFALPLAAAEMIAEVFFIPPDAFGYELAFVLILISCLILLAIRHIRRVEQRYQAKLAQEQSGR